MCRSDGSEQTLGAAGMTMPDPVAAARAPLAHPWPNVAARKLSARHASSVPGWLEIAALLGRSHELLLPSTTAARDHQTQPRALAQPFPSHQTVTSREKETKHRLCWLSELGGIAHLMLRAKRKKLLLGDV
jgi:hypothetical protein